MNDVKDTSGKYLLIGIILVVVVIIGAIVLIIATTDDNVLNNNIEEVENKKQKDKEEKDLKSINTFLKVISKINYIDEKDLYKNNILVIDNNKVYDYYNVNTGKKIYTSNSNVYEWYGSFGIFTDEDNNVLIDDTGTTLFTTTNSIAYYPNTKIWSFIDNIYDTNGLLEENTQVIDDKGYYFVNEKKDQILIQDNKLKTIYSLKLDNDDNLYNADLNSIYDDCYILLSTSKYDIIVNAKNGKEVYKGNNGTINSLDNNLFEIDKDTYFVKDNKLAIKESGKGYKTEVSHKYVAIGNKVYDVNTLKEVDSNTYIPEIEDSLVENLTGLETTECRTGYGLKYKGEELLECKYETISYFNYNITRSLISSNKLYVIISSDNYSYEVYDVYNKKIVLYNVDDYDFNSPFITLYQDDNIFIYNIIDSSKKPNNDGDEVSLYDNYYVLTSSKTKKYYNKDFTEIYQYNSEEKH